MERRILGLDPGLAILGFGSICATSNSSTAPANVAATTTLLDFGVIRTSADTSMGKRLCTIYDDLHTLMQQLQPDLVAIEKLFFYRMASTNYGSSSAGSPDAGISSA